MIWVFQAFFHISSFNLGIIKGSLLICQLKRKRLNWTRRIQSWCQKQNFQGIWPFANEAPISIPSNPLYLTRYLFFTDCEKIKLFCIQKMVGHVSVLFLGPIINGLSGRDASHYSFPFLLSCKKTPLPQIVNKASLINNREFSSHILLVTENAKSFANE